MRTTALAAVALLALGRPSPAAEPNAARPVNYTRDVRPILAEKCYACHGPDDKQRKADLNLDDRESATENAVRPGSAATSPLVERVSSKQPAEMMPPPKSKKGRLTPEQ